LDLKGRSDYDRYIPTSDGTLNTIIGRDPFWGTYFVGGYTPQPPPSWLPEVNVGVPDFGLPWDHIGHANDVVAMAAINGKLFAATKDNRLWWRDPVR
jgi:hypothetical protein